MKQPKKNLFSQSIDLDVDHVESNLKQSTKILQEMKENLAKEVKDYFSLSEIFTICSSRRNIKVI